MDIIFQSGEFSGPDSSFWTDLFIEIISAIIGAGVAIWIFKQGLNKQEKKELKSKIEKYEELENYLFHVIDFINSSINQQVKEFGKTSQALKDFGNRNLRLDTVSALSTDDVNSINSEDLYRIFVSNREGDPNDKAVDVLNLKNCLRYIDHQKAAYIEFNQTLFSRLDEYRTLWNYHIKQLHDLYNQFALTAAQNKVNPGSDAFLDFYRSIMVVKQRELITNGQTENIAELHRELILPLTEFIRESRIMDERIRLITSSVMACDQAFQETAKLRIQKRDTVLKYGRDLLGVKRLMNECINNTKRRKKAYSRY